MSDSTSSTTFIGDGIRYRVTHTVRVDCKAKLFQDLACLRSPSFFCHEDPESPFFGLHYNYGIVDGFLGVFVVVKSDTERAVSLIIHKCRLCDTKGSLLAEKKGTKARNWMKSGDMGWGFDRVYKPVDASKETEWKLFVEFTYEKEATSLPASTSSHDFQTDVLKLLDDPSYADLTFIVQGESIKAHRAFLAVRSQYFQRMFASDVEENVNNEVKVPDIEPETFRGLLHFLYSGSAPENVADQALELLVAADKYDVDGLKQICEEKAAIHRDNVVEALLVADSLQNEKLMTRAKTCFRLNVDELVASAADMDRLKARPNLLIQLISHYAKH